MENKAITFWDLQDQLSDLIDDIAKSDDDVISYDDLAEITDSCIPIYNNDLLDVCKSSLGIGYPDEKTEHEDVYSMIKWSIYESLRDHAHDHCEKNRIEIK